MNRRKITERQERSVCGLILKGWKYREISESMGISITSVKAIASRNGLARTNHRWTEREIAFLKANYRRLGPCECARRLADTHPSMSAVCHQARKLGLTEAAV